MCIRDSTPNPAVSATTSVYLYNSTGAAVTVPKGTMFYVPSTTTADAVYFTSTAEVSVAANTSSGNGQAVAVVEGRAVTETLTTNYFGDPSGTFKLSESGIIPSSLELTVGTATYTHTTRLTEAAASSPAFTSITNSVGDTVIVLGNGINGLVPPGGSTIKVSYRVGGGSKGNVAANAITEMSVPLTGITINISNVAVGGTNPETLASIKANAPTVKRTQNRAVTLLDYESLIATFPGVVKTFTTSASPSGTTTVYYSALPHFSNFETRDSSAAVSLTADFGLSLIHI